MKDKKKVVFNKLRDIDEYLAKYLFKLDNVRMHHQSFGKMDWLAWGENKYKGPEMVPMYSTDIRHAFLVIDYLTKHTDACCIDLKWRDCEDWGVGIHLSMKSHENYQGWSGLNGRDYPLPLAICLAVLNAREVAYVFNVPEIDYVNNYGNIP